MTAKLDVEWREDKWNQEAVGWNLVRHVVRPKPYFRCPSCGSILYTRRHRKCAVCERELPEHLLFSAAEVLRIKAVMMVEQEKHRDWLAKAGQSWR